MYSDKAHLCLFYCGVRFPAIPSCVLFHVAPRLVSGTNIMQKRVWKAVEMRLWDTAASGLVVFLLPLGLLTQGKPAAHVMSSPVRGPASEDLRPPASRRCWHPSEAFRWPGLVAILMVTLKIVDWTTLLKVFNSETVSEWYCFKLLSLGVILLSIINR